MERQKLKTPTDKYLNDNAYQALVDILLGFVEQHQFTVSELREAAVMACYKYEMMRIRTVTAQVPLAVSHAFHTIRNYCEYEGEEKHDN